MAKQRRVAVVGAGIGGLTAALALRSRGLDATVYEKGPDLAMANAGNGLVVWHNAVRCLKLLGLQDELDEIGLPLDAYHWCSASGKRLSEWSIAAGAARTGFGAYTVSRPALHGMLARAASSQVEFGRNLVGWARNGDGVLLTFADGSEETADLLVGADGLRSRVRQGIVPHEPPPEYAGISAWQGLVAADKSVVPPGVFLNQVGDGRWFVAYRVSDELVYWDAVVTDSVSRDITAGSHAQELCLQGLFKGWAEPVPTLLKIARSQAQRVDIYDRAPIHTWSLEGRATLLGDAAHPMTFNLGQGANQAIEGAVVLADCLAADVGIAEALAEYERRRIPRTSELIRRSRMNGRMLGQRGPLRVALRNLVMRTIFDTVVYRKTYELTMDMSTITDWNARCRATV